SESVQTSGRLEAALLKKVPEIVHAVSKTGAPDIATDPMGIDRTDTYLNIKPKEEWRFGKDRLIREIEDTVSETVPEVAISVSQPIQMRTNELIAGIRSDIGVKIFGDSLEELKTIGEKTAEILKKIEGVKDLKIEQLQGLNYIRIRPKRESLARYGVDIFDINQITESLSSGHNAGVLFEGRMKFDITVKLENTVSSLDDIRAVPVRAEGQLVPLGDLASVDLESGPVQIGHENGYRRMLVEFNVRERDMMSVIQEAQEKLSSEIKLPVGYRFEFGGKYKNFISAKNTLMIVVPLTLLLILFFLWLAFGEMTSAMMIFLNVPFAVTGGIIFLFLRSIPFSISAGVGFIALFGVAVLNGLVLISFAKDEELSGKTHREGILSAAHLRLRPVLTTAIVAAIGFIPMALSTSMGAEVQRPLATVVIGGLISSSILTLLGMPAIYTLYFERRKKILFP
ncbi:MAG TPA: efflux RND transporter permease subunit, partial [Leptospiraceae bacterium]|nr:efflux RND transporter permease subunit [Leptospiraceae bacterium]